MATLELILLLAAAVLASSVLDQIIPRISLPLVQIAIGFVIALLATTPIDVALDPSFFLMLFIAPLLFVDAKHADKLGLWHNKRVILSLAVGLVLIIMLAVGFSLNWLVPSIPLTAAFALGAALGPTDAVAVASLRESAHLTRREKALLSGEALLNDASGVVSFQFAIAAAVTGAFSLLDASISFVVSFFGGIIAGIVLALLAHWLQNKIRDLGLESTTFFVLFDVLLPFIIYLAAEVIHVSGILAVVAGGLVISSFSERKIGPNEARLSIVSTSVWRVISFTLNGIVFVLLGLQLPRALQSTWDSVYINNFVLIGYVVAITAVLVLVRFLWLLIMDCLVKIPGTDRHRKLDRDTVRSALVSTIGGPKGAVTLSIIFSIPLFLDDGSIFPQRNLIIFIASGVILLTLLLANFLLPVLAPPDEEEPQITVEDKARAQIEVMRRVIERLTASRTPENEHATNLVISQYNERIQRIEEAADLESESTTRLRIQIIRAMQDFVIEQAEKGVVDDYDGYRYIKQLGVRQNLILHRNNSLWMIRQALSHFRRTAGVVRRIVVEATPGVRETKQHAAFRNLQISAEQHAVALLTQMMEAEDQQYQPEVISKVLLLHQVQLSSLQRTSPDITSYASTGDNMETIERTAYAWELDYIQEQCENKEISRADAKEMRDNVYLMQIDLENHV